MESIRMTKDNTDITLLRYIILWDILVHDQLEHGSVIVCRGGSALELADMGGIDRVRRDLESRHRGLRREM